MKNACKLFNIFSGMMVQVWTAEKKTFFSTVFLKTPELLSLVFHNCFPKTAEKEIIFSTVFGMIT